MGKLFILDTTDHIRAFREARMKIIFFSYQWLSWTRSGPNREQWQYMRSAIGDYCKLKTINLSTVYIWLDILSIPQLHHAIKSLAVNSLYTYATAADVFIVIAPNSKHENTHEPTNLHSYKSRIWCRVEQIAHVCSHGLESMFVKVPDGLTQLEEAWFQEVVRIFDADMTCCRLKHQGLDHCDKESLVLVLLGLWYKMCASQRGIHMHMGLGDEDEGIKMVYALIVPQKDKVFPATMNFVTSDHVERRTLFGDLISRLERHIEVHTDTSLIQDGAAESSTFPLVVRHSLDVFKLEVRNRVNTSNRGSVVRYARAATASVSTIGKKVKWSSTSHLQGESGHMFEARASGRIGRTSVDDDIEFMSSVQDGALNVHVGDEDLENVARGSLLRFKTCADLLSKQGEVYADASGMDAEGSDEVSVHAGDADLENVAPGVLLRHNTCPDLLSKQGEVYADAGVMDAAGGDEESGIPFRRAATFENRRKANPSNNTTTLRQRRQSSEHEHVGLSAGSPITASASPALSLPLGKLRGSESALNTTLHDGHADAGPKSSSGSPGSPAEEDRLVKHRFQISEKDRLVKHRRRRVHAPKTLRVPLHRREGRATTYADGVSSSSSGTTYAAGVSSQHPEATRSELDGGVRSLDVPLAVHRPSPRSRSRKQADDGARSEDVRPLGIGRSSV